MNLMLNLNDPSCILRHYDARMRADPPPEPGVSRTWSGGVLRTTGLYDCIGYSALVGADVDREIAAQVDFFRSLGKPVEWKLYSHDQPADLAERLAYAGFKPKDADHFMVRDLEAAPIEDPILGGIQLREVRDLAGLHDFVYVSGAAFEGDASWAYKAFEGRLSDPTIAFYVAYDGGQPVAAGRLDLPRDRSFASIWGGGTLAAYRGRGIYRALVATRAWEALWRGYRYLTVDAQDTSYQILKRLGFLELAQVTDWIWQPRARK